jgi:hypothetical protein
VLGDGGYRGIPAITDPQRDKTGHIIRDDRYRVHRRIMARVERAIARLKTGKSSVNADAAAKSFTTVFRSSPDSGTSRPTPNYGSTA